MPTINTYFRNEALQNDLIALADGPLQSYVAEQLTCEEIKLAPGNVTVRLMRSIGKGMLAPVEMDIVAAPYPERVERQDEICLNVRQFVLDYVHDLYDAKVWLPLSELGHSEAVQD